MTIKEAVTSFCSVEVPSGAVDLELINSGLDGAGTYSAGVETQTARTAANVLAGLLPLSSFKEGDMTIQLDRDGIKARIYYLANKYGFTDILEVGKPVVRDKSNVW